MLKRFSNFRGMRHSLADGRGFSRAKIGRLGPVLRFRAAVFAMGWRFRMTCAFGRRRRCRGDFGCQLRSSFCDRFCVRLRDFFRLLGFGRLFRMRFTETT